MCKIKFENVTIDPEMQMLDYLVIKTNELNHPVPNLVLNKYLFLFNLINYIEHGEFLHQGLFVGYKYGPTDVDMYPEYNTKQNLKVTHLQPHIYMRNHHGILEVKQIMTNPEQIKPKIKNVIDQYLPNVLTYSFDELVAQFHTTPYEKHLYQRYLDQAYHDFKNYYHDPMHRFWQHSNKISAN